MDVPPPNPPKPGWYWDPAELAFNLALRETWRRRGMYLGPENVYRLRRWDGTAWTEETLRNRVLRGITGLPYLAGPSTRFHPVTPQKSGRGWTIWLIAMLLAGVVAIVSMLTR